MFYLETKDGEKFFTEIDSNDRAEFRKILESKLGTGAAEIFDDLIEEHESDKLEKFNSFAHRYHECINKLDNELAHPELRKDVLDEILSELQDIYFTWMYER